MNRDSGQHRWVSALPVAAMFLTRLPIRAPQTTLSGAVAAFPLVGLAVGALGGGAYWLALLVGLPPLACAFAAVGATVLTTGALHEDGLADMADGMAGRTPDDAIAIMRDSRTGGYGVLAMIFSVGLRVSAIAALGDPLVVAAAMTSAGALSRAAMPVPMRWMRTASGSGLAASAGRPETLDVFLGLFIAVFLTLILAGASAMPAMAGAAAFAAYGIAALAHRRLRGYTGDCLGAVQQAAEIAALLALAAVM